MVERISVERLRSEPPSIRNVNALTPADVQRIARTYLDPQKMVIVIVGDRKAIAEQIAPFGRILP